MATMAATERRPSSAEVPFGWDEIVACVREDTYESLGRLRRSPEQLKVYVEAKAKVCLERFYSVPLDVQLKRPRRACGNCCIPRICRGLLLVIVHSSHNVCWLQLQSLSPHGSRFLIWRCLGAMA